MKKIIKYVLWDILQNKTLIGYALFLLLVTLSLFGMENNPQKGLASLLYVILIILPLISLVFTTIHFYNSYEFIELLLSQPIGRRVIFLSEYLGVAVSLVGAFWLGVGVPALLFVPNLLTLTLLAVGSGLTLIFVSLAFLGSVWVRDKAKGIGVALLSWFYFSLLYDGLVLLVLFSFADYPLEKVLLVFTSFNPIDLGRIMVLIQMDISALMGYTGALYKDFFGTHWGTLYCTLLMLVWAISPMLLALRIFQKKDL